MPDGVITFCALTAFTMSVGDRPCACSRGMSRSTCTWRILPPYGYGVAAPCTVASWVRMKFCPRSNSTCSGSVLLLRPSCTIGVVEAVYVMTSGGVVPGGRAAHGGLHNRRHLRQRGLNVRVRLKEDLDDANARAPIATRCARCC